MKQPAILKEWEKFTSKYPMLFLENDKAWMNTLSEVNAYIAKTTKLPSTKNKNKEIKKMGTWLSTQQKTYSKSTSIMKQSNIRTEWEKFISVNSMLFMTNDESWMNNRDILHKFIKENNKFPSEDSKDPKNKSSALWLAVQKRNYKNSQQIMKNPHIRQLWEDFMKEHSVLFMKKR
jgi:hypothetical protein